MPNRLLWEHWKISIHALREEGDFHKSRLRHVLVSISIHALREEGDSRTSRSTSQKRNFYPRPPRGGRRSLVSASNVTFRFLSTPSARRATSDFYFGGDSYEQISIHALREEGDARVIRAIYKNSAISIHALREEGDWFRM